MPLQAAQTDTDESLKFFLNARNSATVTSFVSIANFCPPSAVIVTEVGPASPPSRGTAPSPPGLVDDSASASPSVAGVGLPALNEEQAEALAAIAAAAASNSEAAALTDADPPGANTRTNVIAGVKAVAAERNAAGDAKVHTFEPDPGDESERTGCEGHGNAQFHQRVAGEIAVQIRAQVGWN